MGLSHRVNTISRGWAFGKDADNAWVPRLAGCLSGPLPRFALVSHPMTPVIPAALLPCVYSVDHMPLGTCWKCRVSGPRRLPTSESTFCSGPQVAPMAGKSSLVSLCGLRVHEKLGLCPALLSWKRFQTIDFWVLSVCGGALSGGVLRGCGRAHGEGVGAVPAREPG